MSPRVHPLSIIVFISGLIIGAVGITLAIVFGVQNSSCPTTSCPVCSTTPTTAPTAPSNGQTDCSAKLFTIRTGVDSNSTGIFWNDELRNSSSPYFVNASTTVSKELAATLNQGGAPPMAFELEATKNVKYVVSVTKFEQADDGVVIAYASAAMTGNETLINNYSDEDVIYKAQSSLNDDGTVMVQPYVNYDSMGFCDAPITDLNRTDPDPSVCLCPTADTCPPCTAITCPEQKLCPTTATECPDCPTSTNCPTQDSCPSTNSTCPPPIVCPTLGTCPPCATLTPSTLLPSTCPSCTTTNCPPPTTCPPCTTLMSCPPAPTCPDTTGTCPPCTTLPPMNCPTLQPTTCPEPPSCPSSTCPPCTTSLTCPPTPTCSDISSSPSTCLTPVCDCGTTTSPAIKSTTTNSAPTSTASAPTSTASTSTSTTSALTSTASTPSATCPPCQCTTFPWSTLLTSSASSVTGTSSRSTSSQGTTSYLPSIPTVSSMSTVSSSTQTSTSPASTSLASSSSTSIVTTSPGSTQPSTSLSSTFSTKTASTASISQGSTLSSSSSSSSQTSPPSSSTSIASSSQSPTSISSTSIGTTSSLGSSTTMESTFPSSTTILSSTQSTTPYCPGGSLAYAGDIAIVFEATYLADGKAQNAQNYMMNAFISKQLMNYGNFGVNQKGKYDLDGMNRNTLPLLIPYPNPNCYGTPSSYTAGPRGIDGINATLSLVDVLISSAETDAKIADGLDFVSTINSTELANYYAVVIVGISNAFVADAKSSADALKANGYHIFTVALNSSVDFSSLASDNASAFILPTPTNANDGIQISTAIGDFLVSKSSKCIGAVTTQSTTTPTSTPSPTPFTITTADMCKQQYLVQDITYLFEDTNDTVNSNLSLKFIPILANLAQRDLKGSGALNINSNFTIQPYPDAISGLPCNSNCDFSAINLGNLNIYMTMYRILGSSIPPNNNGLNDGLNTADQDFATYVRKNGRNETIIVFANSADGIAAATATAQDLIVNKKMTILTIAVGSDFDMSPIASPGQHAHLLTATTNMTELAQEIVSELLPFGSICQP